MGKAVFLDRDGVINVNTHYINSLQDFKLLPKSRDAIKILKECGFKVFVVTNQGGIAKGFIEEKTLKQIHEKLLNLIPEIDDIRFCPNYESFDRKPNPGMIYDLAYEHEIYLNESYMIGDMHTDAIAGRRAGCKTCMVATNIMESVKYANSQYVDFQAEHLYEAAMLIASKEYGV